MTTETTEDYPAEWDKNAPAKASDYLRKKDDFPVGTKLLLRIVQGPRAYSSVKPEFGQPPFQMPDPKNPGETVERYSLRLPFGTTIPGWYVHSEYLFEVILLTGPEAGKHKLWEASNNLKEQMQKAMARFPGGVKNMEFEVYKEVKGKKTSWFAVGGPITTQLTEDQLKPVFNLSDKLKFATKEEIDALPPPPEDKSKAITKPLMTTLLDLVKAKEVSDKQLANLVSRKTDGKKSDVDSLTVGEAQDVIAVLREM